MRSTKVAKFQQLSGFRESATPGHGPPNSVSKQQRKAALEWRESIWVLCWSGRGRDESDTVCASSMFRRSSCVWQRSEVGLKRGQRGNTRRNVSASNVAATVRVDGERVGGFCSAGSGLRGWGTQVAQAWLGLPLECPIHFCFLLRLPTRATPTLAFLPPILGPAPGTCILGGGEGVTQPCNVRWVLDDGRGGARRKRARGCGWSCALSEMGGTSPVRQHAGST